MKKRVQIDLSLTQYSKKTNPIQVNSWVNTALDAKNNVETSAKSSAGEKLQLNMTFSKSILNRR